MFFVGYFFSLHILSKLNTSVCPKYSQDLLSPSHFSTLKGNKQGASLISHVVKWGKPIENWVRITGIRHRILIFSNLFWIPNGTFSLKYNDVKGYSNFSFQLIYINWTNCVSIPVSLTHQVNYFFLCSEQNNSSWFQSGGWLLSSTRISIFFWELL